MNTMKGIIRRVGSGERGFTLIELLVVVAILGIIAAVVVLNIGSFLGTGAAQAANTEAHQVQTAAIAWMTATSPTTISGVTVGPDSATGPAVYLLNPKTLQATYTLASDGSLADGAVKISDSKWGALVFAAGQWS